MPFTLLDIKPPKELLPWLTYVDFLTEKLKNTVGDASLSVLNETWEKPKWWDRYVLNIKAEQVLHRTILMQAWDVPCWCARTIIPDTTYNADLTLFTRLQTESLGHLIFQGDRIKRSSIRHYPIDTSTIEYYWLTDRMRRVQQPLVWGRLSEFTLDRQFSFYLVEILLPGLMDFLT